jgi:hypothetical protein
VHRSPFLVFHLTVEYFAVSWELPSRYPKGYWFVN